MIILDRFEGDYAVLETDSGMINVLKSNISIDAREGSVLIKNCEFYNVDLIETHNRFLRLQELKKHIKK